MTTQPDLTEKQKKDMSCVLYYMSKASASDSFHDFLENTAGITVEEWQPIKQHIEAKLGVELYI